MRILGIDPGLKATGYGVIAANAAGLQLLAAGVLRPSPRDPLAKRLQHLHRGLDRVIETHRPELAVLESLFVHDQHLTTAALMAHARGVACLVNAEHDLTVIEYLPTRIKKAITGFGRASKDQMAKAVGLWLGVETGRWPSDTTDAIALAVAHAQISRISAQLPAVKRRRATSAALLELAGRAGGR